MRPLFFIAGWWALGCAAGAQVTPLDLPLVEEKEIAITCELTKTEPPSQVPVFGSSKQSEKARGTYHYKLWLPPGYLASGPRRWPCMFIAAPGGNASMGAMAGRLQAGGYVAVMLVEARNGPWEPIVGNFLAAHDDVVRRVRIQEGLKLATGMSGGARASSLFVQVRPGFSGLICQAAGFYFVGKDSDYGVAGMRKMPGFLVAMTVGDKDRNAGEIAPLKAALPASTSFRAWTFAGGHGWAPAEVFDEVLTWMERQIYVEGAARPELRAAYLSYFSQQLAALEKTTAPWARYQLVDALLALSRARGLAIDPAVGAQVRALQAEAMKLGGDPAVAREAAAAEEWRRLQAAGKGFAAAKFAADAAEFAKRHPGTEAARKAEAAAATGAIQK